MGKRPPKVLVVSAVFIGECYWGMLSPRRRDVSKAQSSKVQVKDGSEENGNPYAFESRLYDNVI